MSDKTHIQWTQATWNPVTGCSKVSQGCKHCYAEREWARLSGRGQPYAGRAFTDVRCHPERLDQPLRWRRPRRVFVNSMSDLFHPDVPDEFIARVWWVMGQCAGLLDPTRYRGHVFQILTKRPLRMLQWLNRWSDLDSRQLWIESFGEVFDWASGPKYWPNSIPGIWLGVSVEDQATADERIPLLLQTPAAVRWVSCEPLLGPIYLTQIPTRDRAVKMNVLRRISAFAPHVDWVVVGGESGPKARPMHPKWSRSLRDQCADAGVPFFFKQWGEYFHYALDMRDGDTWPWRIGPDGKRRVGLAEALEQRDSWPAVTMLRVGKRAAGRMLDGRTWDEYPDG